MPPLKATCDLCEKKCKGEFLQCLFCGYPIGYGELRSRDKCDEDKCPLCKKIPKDSSWERITLCSDCYDELVQKAKSINEVEHAEQVHRGGKGIPIIVRMIRGVRERLSRKEQHVDPIAVRPYPVPIPSVPSVSVDAGMWLDQARTFSGIQDWNRARDCATRAIQLAPTLVEPYMIRALAFRVIGKLDEAIKDYSSVIEIDPQQGEALMFRGACKTQKASSKHDQLQVLQLLNDAHPDYKRAAELMPDNEQAGLALLELEICAGKYREAVSTTGVWWNRVQGSHNKLICAWLASIAFVLAGKPAQKWIHFREYLDSETVKLNPTEWSIAEINGVIEDLASRRICDAERLNEIKAIHETFLRHFSGSGPAIKQ